MSNFKRLIKPIILLALISLSLCQYKEIPKERVFELDKLPENASFAVEQDQEFAVKIRGNPTTGYSWFLAEEIQEDESLLATNLKENRSTKNYEIDDAPEHHMGVGGFYYFKFKGQRPGTYPLVFVHKRPWETEALAQRAVQVIVKQP